MSELTDSMNSKFSVNGLLKGVAYLENKLDMNWLSILIVLCLSILSFVATFRGFVIFFQSPGSFLDYYMPFMITIIIQSAILLSVWNIRGSHWSTKPFWILIYSLCVFFSVGFGYAFWFEKLRAYDLSQEIAQDTELKIRAPVEAFISQYKEIADYSQTIADASEQKSIEEANTGGTCHPGVPAGYGQMARYRKEDAEVFRSMNERIQTDVQSLERSLSSRIDDKFLKLPAVQQKYSLSLLIEELRQKYDPNQSIEEIRSKVKSRIKKAGTTVTTSIKKGDKNVTREVPLCQPDIAAKQSFLTTLEHYKVPDPPNLDDVVLLDSDNSREVVNYAFGGVIVKMLNMVGLDAPEKMKQDRLYKNTTADYIPLILGINVDLLILLFGRRERPYQVDAARQIQKLGTHYSKIVEYLVKLFEGFSKREIIDVLNKCVSQGDGWMNRNYQFVVLPQHNADKEIRNLQDFFDRLNRHKLCKKKVNRNFRQLPKNIRGSYFRKTKNPRKRSELSRDIYNIYKINTDILMDIKFELGHSKSESRTQAPLRSG